MTFTEDHPIQARMLKTATRLELAIIHLKLKIELTNFHTIVSEKESRKHQLTKSESWAKSREEADRNYTKNVDEEDDQDGVDESKEEDRVCKSSNSEGRDDHVGREPLCFHEHVSYVFQSFSELTKVPI